MLVNRILVLIIGYFCGIFLSGYAYSKSKHKDITTMGSGNAGTTNTFRMFGWKAGLITLLGDVSKPIACTGGMMIAFCPIEVPLSLGIFIVVTALTKYVSLGSILGLISFFIQTVVFGELGLLNVTSHYKMEIYILSAVIMIMGIARHHENIRRLLNGNENKFSLKKKEEGKVV